MEWLVIMDIWIINKSLERGKISKNILNVNHEKKERIKQIIWKKIHKQCFKNTKGMTLKINKIFGKTSHNN